VLCVSIA